MESTVLEDKQLVFTHPNSFLVMNAKNLLDINRINAEVRNEFSVGAVGELSFVDVWPELWVNRWQAAKAKDVLADIECDLSSGMWCCCNCKEENEVSFESCWSCSQDRADD